MVATMIDEEKCSRCHNPMNLCDCCHSHPFISKPVRIRHPEYEIDFENEEHNYRSTKLDQGHIHG